GLIRSYAVKSELLTHLQEDSFPLKYAMPDAPGQRIELPDPDPLSFWERMVPGKMLMHRVDLHFVDSVMEAQDAAGLTVRRFDDRAGPGGVQADVAREAGARLDGLLAGRVDPSAQQSWDRE